MLGTSALLAPMEILKGDDKFKLKTYCYCAVAVKQKGKSEEKIMALDPEYPFEKEISLLKSNLISHLGFVDPQFPYAFVFNSEDFYCLKIFLDENLKTTKIQEIKGREAVKKESLFLESFIANARLWAFTKG